MAKTSRSNLGIGMVDLDRLPAFVNNRHEKLTITDTNLVFNPERKRFDKAYNTTYLEDTIK